MGGPISLGGRTRGPLVGPALGAGWEVGSCQPQASPAGSGQPITAASGSPIMNSHRRPRSDVLQACLGLLPGMSAADDREGYFLTGGLWLSLQPRVHRSSGR